MITGVIGCFLMGVYIDKTQKHTTAMRFITIFTALLFISAEFLLPVGNLGLTSIFAFLAGSLIVPILPSSYSYVSLLTPGMAPAVVNGLMMSGAQFYAIVATLVGT